MAIWSDDKKNKEMAEAIISGISSTVADSITKTMQPVFAELAGIMKEALLESKSEQNKAAADMAESIKGMKAIMESMTKTMQQMETISASEQSILNSLTEVQRAQEQTQKSLTTECETAFNGVRDIQNKLSNLYDGIGNGATALVAREEGVVKNQAKVLDKAVADIEKLQEALTKDYGSVFEELTKSVSTLNDFSHVMENVSKDIRETLTIYRNDMDQTLTTYREGLDRTLTTFRDGIDGSIKAYKEGIEGTVRDTFAIIDNELAEATKTLGRTTEEINEAAARLPKAIRGLA